MKAWIGTKKSCKSISVRLRLRRRLPLALQKNKNLLQSYKVVVKNRIAVRNQRVKTMKKAMH